MHKLIVMLQILLCADFAWAFAGPCWPGRVPRLRAMVPLFNPALSFRKNVPPALCGGQSQWDVISQVEGGRRGHWRALCSASQGDAEGDAESYYTVAAIRDKQIVVNAEQGGMVSSSFPCWL